jgi:arylsulfatase A-like enzyme
MSPHLCIRSATLFLSVTPFLGCADSPESARRPDVVLFVVDTLRNDRLGCYGYPRSTSPGLDALVAEGVVFEDVTAQWPWTLPSMVSLFQGQYLTEYRDSLHPSAMTLPEAFQQAGYHTIGVVGNCLVDEAQGFGRGFDDFEVAEFWQDEERTAKTLRDIVQMGEMVSTPAQAALTLDENGKRAPVLIYIHAFDPHEPYRGHGELNGELPVSGVLAVQPQDYWVQTLQELGNWDELNENERKQARQSMAGMRANRARYDQEVRFLDSGITRIITELKSMGLADNAVFALVSDHGEGLWEHLAIDSSEMLSEAEPAKVFYKGHGGNGYQSGSATPFVMWGGDVPKGLRISAAVENIDLYPTLLELADIAPPQGLHGRSLVSLWSSTNEDWRTHVFSNGSHTIAVRDVESGMKLILPTGKSLLYGRGFELYDLAADPGERNNLVDAQPETVLELAAKHREWTEQYPTESTMKGRIQEMADEHDSALAEKLQALGYTEADTGIPGLGDGDEDGE